MVRLIEWLCEWSVVWPLSEQLCLISYVIMTSWALWNFIVTISQFLYRVTLYSPPQLPQRLAQIGVVKLYVTTASFYIVSHCTHLHSFPSVLLRSALWIGIVKLCDDSQFLYRVILYSPSQFPQSLAQFGVVKLYVTSASFYIVSHCTHLHSFPNVLLSSSLWNSM
jgi:hypothetical protein